MSGIAIKVCIWTEAVYLSKFFFKSELSKQKRIDEDDDEDDETL